METPILVAIIGGAVTIVGFVISGLFGVLASASQREAAASLGVEKALNERLKGKDDNIAYLEKKVVALSAREAELEAELEDRDARIQKMGMESAERDQWWQRKLREATGGPS